jgi:hypothetical protein
MKVKVARTGRTVALSRPQRMFAQDRSTVQEGFAGDVIGLSNPGAFAVGDTLYAGALGGGREGALLVLWPGTGPAGLAAFLSCSRRRGRRRRPNSLSLRARP